jgi:hypothetical protein
MGPVTTAARVLLPLAAASGGGGGHVNHHTREGDGADNHCGKGAAVAVAAPGGWVGTSTTMPGREMGLATTAARVPSPPTATLGRGGGGHVDHRAGEGDGATDQCGTSIAATVDAYRAAAIRLAAATALLAVVVDGCAARTIVTLHCPRSVSPYTNA